MSDNATAISSLIFGLLVIAGWLTHIIVTIQASQWLLLLAGAILFPIGIIHGWGLWVGLF